MFVCCNWRMPFYKSRYTVVEPNVKMDYFLSVRIQIEEMLLLNALFSAHSHLTWTVSWCAESSKINLFCDWQLDTICAFGLSTQLESE